MKSNIRRFWQASVAEEERIKREEARSSKPKPYSFPRWRSTDALSASLVASNSVELPKDSKIPEQRLQKMYDRDKIRSSVYKESIGNVAEARERFESQADHTQSRKAHRYQHRDPARPSVPEVEHVGRVTPSQITVYPGCSQGSSQPYYGAENGNHDHHIYSNGRYLKKGQSASSSPIYSKVRKHEPRDGHGDDHMQPPIERRVSSLIESEIKQLRRREDELHESRRELGLPSLEELMESWKQGPRSYRSDSNQRSTPVQRPSQLSSPNGSWNH
ncbi:unnamed protein product [Nippostrongylus brasiliensis]|uniref:Regulating synaptic membrane exocytosis protein 2 n=1 Tax=Nippostrongylus brasiliensis TaxID=27835 RepID=A0A0N4Y6B8_NIPBR|nr:unnamed protein product [Nippostrongylus brasiliensis]